MPTDDACRLDRRHDEPTDCDDLAAEVVREPISHALPLLVDALRIG